MSAGLASQRAVVATPRPRSDTDADIDKAARRDRRGGSPRGEPSGVEASPIASKSGADMPNA